MQLTPKEQQEEILSSLLKLYKNNSLAMNADKFDPKVDLWETIETTLGQNEKILSDLINNYPYLKPLKAYSQQN